MRAQRRHCVLDRPRLDGTARVSTSQTACQVEAGFYTNALQVPLESPLATIGGPSPGPSATVAHYAQYCSASPTPLRLYGNALIGHGRLQPRCCPLASPLNVFHAYTVIMACTEPAVDDVRMLELLDQERSLAVLHEEVDAAVSAWLAKLDQQHGADGMDAAVAETNMFWKEEIERRLGETADEILAWRLLQAQKQEMKRAAASRAQAAAADEEAARHVAELLAVEEEFEAAMQERCAEQEESIARKVQVWARLCVARNAEANGRTLLDSASELARPAWPCAKQASHSA